MTRTIERIQKRENLNTIKTDSPIGPGGAYHTYVILRVDTIAYLQPIAEIQFQKGPRHDPKSTHGVLDTDLLEIVRDRLTCFQQGEYATRETAIALTKIENALVWLNKRVEDRIERNVLGTYEK